MRIKSLIKYVTLFRTNNLVLKKRKVSTVDIENLNHSNQRNEEVNFNNDNDAGDDSGIGCENEDENENENENDSIPDENSFIRIFSWNGNKDLNVSLLPDLPLLPCTESVQNLNGKYMCTYLD